jgi:hypothetical protein
MFSSTRAGVAGTAGCWRWRHCMRCVLLCKVALCSIAGCAAPVVLIITSSLMPAVRCCSTCRQRPTLCHGHVSVLLLPMLLQGPHTSTSRCVSVRHSNLLRQLLRPAAQICQRWRQQCVLLLVPCTWDYVGHVMSNRDYCLNRVATLQRHHCWNGPASR